MWRNAGLSGRSRARKRTQNSPVIMFRKSYVSVLVLSSNSLYGRTASGGTNGNGTIFKINTDGTGYGILRSLTNSPSPEGGMVLIGSTLYGTTFTGGATT